MTSAPNNPSYENVALLNEGEKETYVQTMQSTQSLDNTFIYQISGRPAFAFGDIWLKQGQKIICDSNALLWMTGGLEVDVSMPGGCCTSFLRTCGGEACCMNTYTATGDNERLTVGITLPGDVMAFGVTKGAGWILTFDAFVAGTNNLRVSSRFSGCCACLCGDETPFMTKVTTDDQMAVFLAGGYGMIERHDIPEGTTMLVSRGLFFAARDDTQFEVGLIGKECMGLQNCCCTGGGIVLKFHGPATIYTQSKNPMQLLRDFGLQYGKAGVMLRTGLKFAVKAAEQAGQQ